MCANSDCSRRQRFSHPSRESSLLLLMTTHVTTSALAKKHRIAYIQYLGPNITFLVQDGMGSKVANFLKDSRTAEIPLAGHQVQPILMY